MAFRTFAAVGRQTLRNVAPEVVAAMQDGLAVHDARGRLVSWNAAAQRITGWDLEDAARHFPTAPTDGLTDLGGGRWVHLRRATAGRRRRRLTTTLFSDARHQIALRDAYAQMDDLVTTDSLTSLPNRVLADDRLVQSVTLAARDTRPIALLFVDLDRFKLINDNLGHEAGDDLLQRVAVRIRKAVRETDTVARVGGDEFVVILHSIAQAEDAELVASSILDAMATHFTIDGHEIFLSCSIGIAVFPDHGDDPPTLRSHADLAMYRAKADGGNTYRLYAPVMSELTRERLLIAGDLHRALDRDELVLHYQPQIDMNSGMAIGAEALIRWRHPHRGLVAPDLFLSVAEEDGSIVDIDRWVVRTACEQMNRWDGEGTPLPMVSVNISARSMLHGDVVGMVADALAATRLSPERLEIEVSEHVVAGQGLEVEHRLIELRALGIQLAIDDFGTGYSSLGHLKRFPLDTIKLDRSFVVDVTGRPDEQDIAILRAVVTMARDLRLRCIAEGVETIDQRKMLRYLNCYLVQGYLYSKPVCASDLPSRLGVPVMPTVALAGG